MSQFLKKYHMAIAMVILAFFTTVSILNTENDSATYDEIAHIPAGYSYLTEHDMRLNPEHPPLIKDIAAFPLLFLDVNFDTTQEYWTKDVNGQWDAGRHLLYKAGNDPDQIIFWSRIPIVILSVILGLFLFFWAKKWIGIIPALLALTLYAFDPNILGHNHFVTTDIGIAAFITFSFYYFIRFIKKPTWKNVALGGFFLGLVHLAKFSSVLMMPVFALVIIAYPLFKYIASNGNSTGMKRALLVGEYIGKGALAFIFSIAIVWVAYWPHTYAMPPEILSKTIDRYIEPDNERLLTRNTNAVLQAMNKPDVVRPLATYSLGVSMVFKRVAGGNDAYYLGEVSNHAFPSYFPIVFLMKETLPFIFLILLVVAYSGYEMIKKTLTREFIKRNWTRFRQFMQNGVTSYTLFGFILLYAYLSITGNLNIGFRHLFPILPFAYLLIAKKIADIWKVEKSKVTQNILSVSIVLLLLWNIVGTVQAYPYYLSYFNESIGGSMNGYKYVTDSNADWGQDIKRLRNWINDHNTRCEQMPKNCLRGPIEKIRVDYFGGGNIPYYIGEERLIAWWDSKRPIEPGWYAISANFFQGSIYHSNKADDESYRWLLDQTPVTQVGTSIFIYYVESPR